MMINALLARVSDVIKLTLQIKIYFADFKKYDHAHLCLFYLYIKRFFVIKSTIKNHF